MIIYLITNTVTGKLYVGQTSYRLSKRWACHKCKAIKGAANHPLSAAIRKYGIEAFTQEVIGQFSDGATTDLAEQLFIQEFNTLSPKGYNLALGGRVNRGMKREKWTEERKKRMRTIMTGRKTPWLNGKKLSLEARQKLSVAHKGKPWSDARRAAYIANPPQLDALGRFIRQGA